MNKKIGICAGLFVVAMFLLTSVPVIAEEQQQQQQGQQMQGQQQGISYQDEQYSFPPQLPPGTSLSCITKRRALDPWHLCIYDVGFSWWVMRLRDGPAQHWLNFPYGQISVVLHKGQNPQILPHPKYLPWQDYVMPGWDIYRLEQWLFPQAFYTATFSGYIYKDMGAPEWKTKDFVGYNYYLENNLLQNPMTLEQISEQGFTAQ
jgi:hypothetical protein